MGRGAALICDRYHVISDLAHNPGGERGPITGLHSTADAEPKNLGRNQAAKSVGWRRAGDKYGQPEVSRV
jgi:hypothetical protein